MDLIFISPVFPLLPFFWSRNQFKVPLEFSCQVYLVSPSLDSYLFLSSFTLTSSKCQWFCRISFRVDLCDAFLWLGWSQASLTRTPQVMVCSSQSITLWLRTGDVNFLITWLRWCLSDVSTVKVLFFFFPLWVFYRGISCSYTVSVIKCKVLVTQSCPAVCNPIDYSLPGSSIHWIFQARILEWVAISFSRGFSDPGIQPRSPALQADSLSSEPFAH